MMASTTLPLLLVVLLSLLSTQTCASFQLNRQKFSTSSSATPSQATTAKRRALTTSRFMGINGDVEEFENRMDIVRSLQNTFYKSSGGEGEESKAPHREGDCVMDLPLWRVPWTELPGRSNLLNVHQGHYTNMFEIILNGPKPWYVGHLYLPGGTSNLNSDKYQYQLKTWRDEAKDENKTQQQERTAVVGTLLRITDFRRINDGRLLLLVQATERFVVDQVIQEVPYSKAHVTIVPDFDDATDVPTSFDLHDFEYQDTKLPIVKKDYIDTTDVTGYALQAVVPFVPYTMVDKPTTTTTAAAAAMTNATAAAATTTTTTTTATTTISTSRKRLESELLDGGILRDPPSHPEFTARHTPGLSTHDLEQRLWMAISDLCGATQIKLPDTLLCLIPHEYKDWPTPIKQRLPADYPAARRQRRLSFSASALLESLQMAEAPRQFWLETPSTHERLRALLDRFELVNMMVVGEFQ